MTRLTRRDFLRICGTSSIGLALAACGVTPTPTATPAPTNTALPTLTNTPIPTNTLTLTPTPTLTNTPAPTSTPTRTPTAMPTATTTPRPMQILFQDDFEHGLQFSPEQPEHWSSGYWQQGAKYELIDWPGKGKVLKFYVSGDRFLEGGDWWRRAQLSWGIGTYESRVTTPAPCATSCDIWLSNAIANPIYQELAIGLLSVHTPYSQSRSPGYSIGFWINTPMKWGYNHHDDTNKSQSVRCDAMQLPAEQWFNLTLVFEQDGRVLPYFNGILAIRNPSQALVIYPGFDRGFGDTHAGLITARQNRTPDYPEGAFLLNDNFRVIKYLA